LQWFKVYLGITRLNLYRLKSLRMKKSLLIFSILSVANTALKAQKTGLQIGPVASFFGKGQNNFAVRWLQTFRSRKFCLLVPVFNC